MAGTQLSKSLDRERFYKAGDERPAAPMTLAAERPLPVPLPEDPPDLLATIESEIIPRLMLAHRVDPLSRTSCADSRAPPTESEVFEFARIAACHDLSGALGFVEAICRQGLSLEEVLVDLVAPAARLLGEQWQDDLRSFTDVCAGLGTLQQVVHVLGPSFAPALPHRGLVVLMAAPGEQHTLGLYLVGEFLRRAGWGVQVAPTLSEAEVLRLVASERVVMLGITISNEDLLEPLSSLIGAVREASKNPEMTVMLGGSLDLGDYAARHGATLCASDPREAVRALELHATVRACKS